MGEERTSGGIASVLVIAVLTLSTFWVLVRPDLWAWALGFAVITLIMLKMSHNAGVRQGLESAMKAQPVPQDKVKPEEKTIDETRLEAFQTVMAEAELFAYELKHDLVPDGNSEDNPGYGPMDFNEWREWKQREYERTGNLWHNHPGGLPPKKDDAA